MRQSPRVRRPGTGACEHMRRDPYWTTEGRAPRGWCRARSKHWPQTTHQVACSLGRLPLVGSWAAASLEGTGRCSVFGKAHGKAVMLIFSPLAAPVPSPEWHWLQHQLPVQCRELDPAADLQKQSFSRVRGISVFRFGPTSRSRPTARAKCTAGPSRNSGARASLHLLPPVGLELLLASLSASSGATPSMEPASSPL